MKKNIVYLCLLGLTLGCSKDKGSNDSIDAARYRSGNTLTVNTVLMYTKGGQITDTSRIRIYLQQQVLFDLFLWKTSSESYRGKEMILDLTTDKYVSVTIGSDKGQYEILEKADAGWILASTDSISYFKEPPAPGDCSDFNGVNPQRKLMPEKCIPVSGPGSSELCKRRTVLPVNTRDRNPYIPFFSIRIQKSSGCSYFIPNEANNFNDYLTTALQTGDTLLVQTKELPLTKL